MAARGTPAAAAQATGSSSSSELTETRIFVNRPWSHARTGGFSGRIRSRAFEQDDAAIDVHEGRAVRLDAHR